MKKRLIAGWVLGFFMIFTTLPLYAQQVSPLPREAPVQGTSERVSLYSESDSTPVYEESMPSAEAIIADTLVVRPLGMVACTVGLIGGILSYPFAALSHSEDSVKQRLLIEPFEYTFQRPVGSVKY